MERGKILKPSDLKDMHGSITLEYTGILYAGVNREKKHRELAKVNPQEYCLALGVNDEEILVKDGMVNTMEIILLGKRLEDYPETEYYERRLIYTTYSSGFREHNIAAFKSRLKKYFDYEVINHFVKDGNDFLTTDEIIAAVRVSLSLNLLTDEEWKKAIPIIERGLEANKAYVRMLDEMSVILEKYCEEWEDLGMRHTFMQRVPHECWQGRFSRHSQNSEQKPNYS